MTTIPAWVANDGLGWCGMKWNSNDYATGGLQLSYCLNNTDIGGTCGCDKIPPDKSSCVALVDHHDGTYSGALNGSAVGTRHHASFRFFQRVAGHSPDGELTEIVSTSAAARLICHARLTVMISAKMNLWANSASCRNSFNAPRYCLLAP